MVFVLRHMVVLNNKTNQRNRMIIFKLALLVVGYYLGRKLEGDLTKVIMQKG